MAMRSAMTKSIKRTSPAASTRLWQRLQTRAVFLQQLSEITGGSFSSEDIALVERARGVNIREPARLNGGARPEATWHGRTRASDLTNMPRRRSSLNMKTRYGSAVELEISLRV